MQCVLFGSRAPGGSPRKDSDVDIALILSDGDSKNLAADALKSAFPDASVDVFPDYCPRSSEGLHLLVLDEAEFNNPNHLLSHSVRKGVTLKV